MILRHSGVERIGLQKHLQGGAHAVLAAQLAPVLATFPAGDVWGIGHRWGTQLLALGIRSAHDLAQADAALLRGRFGVVMERTVRELRGVSSQPLEDVSADKQQIVSSRSFGRPVTVSKRQISLGAPNMAECTDGG